VGTSYKKRRHRILIQKIHKIKKYSFYLVNHHNAKKVLLEIITETIEVVEDSLTGPKDVKFVKGMKRQIGKLPKKMEKNFNKTKCTFNFTEEIARGATR